MEQNPELQELTPVLYGTLPVKMYSFHREAGHMALHPHWHERIELLVIDEGSLRLTLRGEEIVVVAGEVAIVNPGYTHVGYAGEEGVTYRVIIFELLDQFAKDRNAANALRPILNGTAAFSSVVREDAIFSSIVEEISDVCTHPAEDSGLRLLGLVYLLLARLNSAHLEPRPVSPLYEKRLQNVLAYLAEHYSEDISVRGLSTQFGYEVSYFCRLFLRVTGLRATEYIRILRLEKARKLLKTSDDSITNIATACGFSDANYFARCFKTHYGVTAGDYRKKNTPKSGS